MCGAPKAKSGEPCTQEAGAGTDHPGTGRCRWHEDSKKGLVGAARGLGLSVPVTPTQAIQGVLHMAAGELAYVHAKVAELEESEYWTEAGGLNKWIRWRDRIQDKVAKYAQVAVAMGVAEEQANLAVAQTKLMGVLLERVMNELDLTDAQRKKVGPTIRRELATVETTAKELV